MKTQYTKQDLILLSKHLWKNRNNQDFMWEYFLDEWLKDKKKQNTIKKNNLCFITY